MGSPCELAGAFDVGPTPASQGKSFFGSFFTKKDLLYFDSNKNPQAFA
jgi:hypothetical protein